MPDESVVNRIKRERALVDSLLSTQTPERLWREPFTAPLERLTVTGAFGTARIINGTGASSHGGLDLRAPMGEPIKASNDGVVALTGEHYYSGRAIYIDHGTGLYSMYFHCEKILVKEGERVTRGQMIGTVGMTGRATGPHLHWGFTLGRARVDPVSVLSLPVRAGARGEVP
jgi:murein DD-endopeptidase MepM/ murein hydrolase activator NlpD